MLSASALCQDSTSRQHSTALLFTYDGDFFGRLGALHWLSDNYAIVGQLAFDLVRTEPYYGPGGWQRKFSVGPVLELQRVLYCHDVLDLAILARYAPDYTSTSFEYSDQQQSETTGSFSWRHSISVGLRVHVALTTRLTLSGTHTISWVYDETRHKRNPYFTGPYSTETLFRRGIAADTGELALLFYL